MNDAPVSMATAQTRTAAARRGREHTKFSLCPACSACPEVETTGDEVGIREAGNLAMLTKDEWNVLVGLIRTGQLAEL